MKIERLLDPAVPGANNGGTTPAVTTLTPTPTPTPTSATPEPSSVNPGEAAKAARDERLARDVFEEPSTEPTTPATTTNKPAATATTPPQPTASLSAEQIAEIAARAAASARPQQPQQVQAPQLTQEEIDKQLGVVKITPEMCVELGLPAEAAPFLDKLQKAIVTNAVRMSNVIVEQKVGEINRTIAPHISFAQQQQYLMLEHQFNEANPDLKGFEPVIKEMSRQLKDSGFRGTREQAFAKIAENTRTYLSGLGIDTKARANGGSSSAATTTTTQKPTMSTVSKGSQGGAGGAPKASSKESWKDIWSSE